MNTRRLYDTSVAFPHGSPSSLTTSVLFFSSVGGKRGGGTLWFFPSRGLRDAPQTWTLLHRPVKIRSSSKLSPWSWSSLILHNVTIGHDPTRSAGPRHDFPALKPVASQTTHLQLWCYPGKNPLPPQVLSFYMLGSSEVIEKNLFPDLQAFSH